MALTIASFCCGLRAARELVAVRAALTVRQMLPEAFVVNFIFLECKPNPHLPSPSLALFATRCGCVEALLRSVVRVLPVILAEPIFWRPVGSCFIFILKYT